MLPPIREILVGGLQIVQYLNSISPDETYDLAWFATVFKNKQAKLKRVPTVSLRPLVSCKRDEIRIKTYQIRSQFRPPLFVDNSVIIDGAHRWLSALANEEIEIEAYVTEDINVESGGVGGGNAVT